MTLAAYSNVIRNLPYLDQAFETKKNTWERQYDNSVFKKYCDSQFKEEAILLSRRDLFEKCKGDFYGAIVSIIFWGYPRNMRGNHFTNILNAIPEIKKALSKEKFLTQESFKQICEETKKTGVGLSTLSKFLYFFEFNLEGYQCLILDKRIIEVINKRLYNELSAFKKINEYNKLDSYTEYLKEMDKISKAESYKPDQLEFFLFHFGKNLKSEN